VAGSAVRALQRLAASAPALASISAAGWEIVRKLPGDVASISLATIASACGPVSG